MISVVAAVNVSPRLVTVIYSSQIFAAVVIAVSFTSALVAPIPSEDMR